MKSTYPIHKVPEPINPRWRLAISMIFLWLFCSLILGTFCARNFIFFYWAEYDAVAWWVFLSLLPIAAWLIWRLRKQLYIRLKEDCPTWWVRWFISIPLMMTMMPAMLAGLVVMTPYWWIAIGTSFFGSNKIEVGKITSISIYNPNNETCTQRGDLHIFKVISNICLDDFVDVPFSENRPMSVFVRRSRYGFIVQSIQKRD